MIAQLKDRLKKNWFLLSIVLAIVVAKFQPWIGAKDGPLAPEYTVKYVAVFVIFFNSGLSIKTEEFSKALYQLEVHAFIQLFTLGFIPVFVKFLIPFLTKLGILRALLTGFQVVACMPPPVSSAVILTKAAEGNEAVAIFNSAFGSFLGIFVTPMLLLQLVGTSSSVPVSKIFNQLFLTVVLPIILGNAIRRNFKDFLDRQKIPYSLIGNLVLLLIIFTTFCDTFSSSNFEMDKLSLLQIAFVVVIFQIFVLTLTFNLSTNENVGKKLRFQPADTVAIIFCSTHKSLTLGIPMLKIIFSQDPNLPLYSIPLLVYHPTQILLGGTLVPAVHRWMKKEQKKIDNAVDSANEIYPPSEA
ncbi:sodium/bile acid cotransporter 7-like [Symsagittifera roscoffensis]|uniref:sodium/bile acid cotransporter 7-like n=1 Tax=Symsagittifera roscoffensis TaxID=84072 RepID=UPI00307C2CFE